MLRTNASEGNLGGEAAGRAPSRRTGAGRAVAPPHAAVRLLAAPGAEDGRPADRGGHALPAAAPAGGEWRARELVEHRRRRTTAVLLAQRRGAAPLPGHERYLAPPSDPV